MRTEIWTDASTYPSNPGHIGVAFCAESEGVCLFGRAYGGYGTSNFAELLAISHGLEVLRPSPRDDVTLYTDSQYALKVLDGDWPPGPHGWLIRSIRAHGVKIRGLLIDLVKGHSGVDGNERANWLAYRAAKYGAQHSRSPLYLLRDEWARMLQVRVLPRRPRLPAPLRDEVDELQQKIRRGKRSLNDDERLVLRRAGGLIGEEGRGTR